MKKVLFVGEDKEFCIEYQTYEPESEFIASKLESIINPEQEYDILIISDREVPPLSLTTLIQAVRAKQSFYLISNSPKNTIIENKIAVCKQHSIKEILPRLTNAQIIQRILGIVSKSRGLRNVCSVLGSHPQVGTTMVTLNLAKKLAEYDHSVCVLGLNQFNPGITFVENFNGNTLDEMYTQIIDNPLNIKPHELINYMHHDENRKFHYLAGNQDFSKRGYFKSEVIEHVIEMASDQFEFVILDVGFSPCSNLTLQGLFKSEVKLLVANQQPLSSNMWNKMNKDILSLLGITTDEFLLVINRYKLDLPNDSQTLQNRMNVPVIATIGDYGVEGTICEMERKILSESRDKNVQKKTDKSFEELANIVRERILGVQIKPTTKEKQGIWPWNKKTS